MMSIESQAWKEIERILGFKVECMNCRSWMFDWEDRKTHVWIKCKNCTQEYLIRKMKGQHPIKESPPEDPWRY